MFPAQLDPTFKLASRQLTTVPTEHNLLTHKVSFILESPSAQIPRVKQADFPQTVLF